MSILYVLGVTESLIHSLIQNTVAYYTIISIINIMLERVRVENKYAILNSTSVRSLQRFIQTQRCFIPMTGWIHTKEKESIISVNSNLQTGSDFRLLASRCLTVNQGISHVVHSSLKKTKAHQSYLTDISLCVNRNIATSEVRLEDKVCIYCKTDHVTSCWPRSRGECLCELLVLRRCL